MFFPTPSLQVTGLETIHNLHYSFGGWRELRKTMIVIPCVCKLCGIYNDSSYIQHKAISILIEYVSWQKMEGSVESVLYAHVFSTIYTKRKMCRKITPLSFSSNKSVQWRRTPSFLTCKSTLTRPVTSSEGEGIGI